MNYITLIIKCQHKIINVLNISILYIIKLCTLLILIYYSVIKRNIYISGYEYKIDYCMLRLKMFIFRIIHV